MSYIEILLTFYVFLHVLFLIQTFIRDKFIYKRESLDAFYKNEIRTHLSNTEQARNEANFWRQEYAKLKDTCPAPTQNETGALE